MCLQEMIDHYNLMAHQETIVESWLQGDIQSMHYLRLQSSEFCGSVELAFGSVNVNHKVSSPPVSGSILVEFT